MKKRKWRGYWIGGGEAPSPVQVLLADTTGGMFKFIKAADIVIMGKSFAGHDEGRDLIEPALLDKPVVTTDDAGLTESLRRLLADGELCRAIGKRGGDAIRRHCGAAELTIRELTSL